MATTYDTIILGFAQTLELCKKRAQQLDTKMEKIVEQQEKLCDQYDAAEVEQVKIEVFAQNLQKLLGDA